VLMEFFRALFTFSENAIEGFLIPATFHVFAVNYFAILLGSCFRRLVALEGNQFVFGISHGRSYSLRCFLIKVQDSSKCQLPRQRQSFQTGAGNRKGRT
jgi:hypothetical protein